jgi:hypothetical protein
VGWPGIVVVEVPQPGGEVRGAFRGLPGVLLLAAAGSGGAVGDDPGEALRGHLFDVFDDRALVGGGEAGLAAEDDHGRRDFPVLQGLGGLQRLGRFGALRQVGGGLVAFGVSELARQVGAEGDEDSEEPEGEDDPLGSLAGWEGEEGAAHLRHLYQRTAVSSSGVVTGA